MRLVCLLYILIIATACHKKSAENADVSHKAQPSTSQTAQPAKKIEPEIKMSKVFRESVFFAKSLEREALKLILKDNSVQKHTLFSVMSYAIETYSGSKKSAPLGLDCSKFEFKFFQPKTIVVSKSCFRPAVEIATITVNTEDRDYEFKFKINAWGSVIGDSAAFTGSDIVCRLRIVDQKLNHMRCENWTHQVSQEQTSVTVVKTDEFLFQRHAEKQFVIRGGFYRELILNRKIDIEIPIEGRIKVIEKEIKVVDDFQQFKDGVFHEQNEKKEPIEIGGKESPKNPEQNFPQAGSVESGEAQQGGEPEKNEAQSENNGQAEPQQSQQNGEHVPTEQIQQIPEQIQPGQEEQSPKPEQTTPGSTRENNGRGR